MFFLIGVCTELPRERKTQLDEKEAALAERDQSRDTLRAELEQSRDTALAELEQAKKDLG